MNSNVKFTEVKMSVVIGGVDKDIIFTPSVGVGELLGQTFEVLSKSNVSAVHVPVTGKAINQDTKEELTFGLGKSEEFMQLCKSANIQVIVERGEKKMNNQTTEVKKTSEEWSAELMERAAKFVNENGSKTTKNMMNNVKESEAAEELAYAVAFAANDSGKKDEANSILSTLNPLIQDAKHNGQRFLSWLGSIALIAWKKISAAVVGAGVFGFHTVGILFNHSVAAGKEIGSAFKVDVIDRVTRA
jgi:hypothetical protein